MKKAVVLLSGGIDSSVLAYYLYNKYEVLPLCILYGQRHAKEIYSAQAIASSLGLTVKATEVDSSLFAGSALTSNIAVPKQSYDKESMGITVVPNRNMVFLALATAYAVSIGADVVSYAAHSGDHYLYPDCRPKFTRAMNVAINLATGIELYTPFANYSKADIVKLGLELGVPFEKTWSCYEGLEEPCGKCGTCVERIAAFEANGIPDPLMGKKASKSMR